MHADPELLSLLALGEDVGSDDERRHVRTCSQCSDELTQLHRLVTLGRTPDVDTDLTAPSDAVWTRIRHELALDLAPEAAEHPTTTLPAVAVAMPEVDEAVATGKPGHRSPLAAVKAAFAGLVRGAGDQLAARAELAPVEAGWSDASGVAEVATDKHGRRLLQVALHADLPSAGIRQAWLVHRDDPTLRQTLGILDGPHGLWTVEQSIDLEEYPILDISQQRTGQTAHSGRTIVRGELTLVS